MNLSKIHTYSQKEIEDYLIKASHMYHNTNKLLMNDKDYDFTLAYLLTHYPESKLKDTVGHEITGKSGKVDLPYYMGSMDNYKTEKKVESWKKDYPSDYVIMDKLDGVSGLLQKDGKGIQLFTRGNGKQGKNISHLIPYLNIPDLSSHSEITVRGEIIVKSTVYDKLKSDSANSRSFVSGLVNSKKPNVKDVKAVDFVAYEMLYPEFKISEQLKKMKRMGFNVVNNTSVKSIDFKYLQETLKEFKSNSDYLIDGIIIRHNHNYSYNKSGNPDYAFAFKMLLDEQIETTEVVKVHWNVSKYRKLFPRVQIKKVKIGGINIEYVSGKSAQYIFKNKIGPGAIVEIARSCDVIPDIVKIVKKAKYADMPDTDYEWNETEMDIFSVDKDDDETCKLKLITDFFKTIKVDGLGPGIVKKIYDDGYTEIEEILHITEDDLLDIEGFQETLARKIVKNMKSAIKSANLIDLMNASNVFGRGLGKKKLEVLFSNIPNLMERQSNNSLVYDIMEVDGFSDITAKQFVNNFDEFKTFMKKLDIKTPNLKEYVKKGEIKRNIVFTGFRNNDLEKMLEKNKIGVNNSINANTFLVIKKDNNTTSSKLKDAEKKKIKIITIDTFLKNKDKFIKSS